jgi:hypothetical protein
MEKLLVRLLFRGTKSGGRRRVLAMSLSEQILRRVLRMLRSKPEVVYRTELRAGDRFEISTRRP